MIKFDSENGVIAISGTLAELSAETLAFIRMIYLTIEEKNEDSAEIFKDIIIKYLHTAFMSNEDLKENTMNNLKKMKDTNGKLSKLLDILKDLSENTKNFEDDNIKESDGNDMMSYEEFKKMINKKESE